MSSLYKPFSVSDGPCKDAILRRGSTPLQHPASLTRIASAGGGSARTFTPIPNIYPGQRNLAAAAIGGRKITHPWKAILAGKCVLCLCWKLTSANVLVDHAAPYYARDHNNSHARLWIKCLPFITPPVCHNCETHCQSMTCLSVLVLPEISCID